MTPRDALDLPDWVEDEIAGLEAEDHRLSVVQWHDYLVSVSPRHFAVKRPRIPTAARPGSAEKIEVMELRAGLGQALFCPRDVTLQQLSDRESLEPVAAGNFWTVGGREGLTPQATDIALWLAQRRRQRRRQA